MSAMIELRVFMDLVQVFKERNWPIPMLVNVENGISGGELMTMLNIPRERVEIIFINGHVSLPSDAFINPGDRVALVPPGTPGPYRVLLGFKNRE